MSERAQLLEHLGRLMRFGGQSAITAQKAGTLGLHAEMAAKRDTPGQLQLVELEHFKALLIRLRQDLLATNDAGRDAAGTVVLDQSSVGRLSRMDALQGQAMAIEAQRRRELQLKHIELALARITTGEYGVCLGCNEDIDPRRLEIDPTATLCIACASQRDS